MFLSGGLVKKVGGVIDAWDVDVNDTMVDLIADKVGSDIDVFHTGWRVGVMCARDGRLGCRSRGWTIESERT